MPSPSADQLPYLGSLLDHSEDAIVACDADWRVRVWNEGARRMYGWTAEEAIGRPATFLRFDESDEQRMDRRRYVAEHGRWRGEIMVLRKDGSKVPVEAIGVAIRDDEGEMSGYLKIHRDITERRCAEEALRAANQRTEAILDRIRDTFFAVDDQWRYTYVNDRAVDRAREAWGRAVSAEELLGENCWELFPEHLGTAFDHELHRAVREQRVVEFETYSVPRAAWVEVRVYPSGDGLSVYSRDVTARRRGREALAYHRALLDNVEDGVIATDADDFRITAWNKGAERLYGFTADEVLGRPAREVASYPGDEARHKLEHELLETGRTRIEFMAHRKDGIPIEVELIAAEVTDARGKVTGYLGIHRDIGERKLAERAEERVEAAREAERARIARALHDDALQGLGDAIALVAMADRTTAASRLADQLLAVLREVGEQLRSAIYDLQSENEEPTPFVERLERLVDQFGAMMGSCEIQLEIGDGVPSRSLGVEGFEVLRIVGEAVTNARRHADARCVRVRVWGSSDRLWAEVSDDGRGFDTARPVSPIHHGLTGMRERAELIKGRLEIHGEPGVGTRVRLEAPLAHGTRRDP